MNGIWILLLLILTAVFPAIIVFFWFRVGKPLEGNLVPGGTRRRVPLTLPWFLASLAAGILSLFAAAMIQHTFFLPVPAGTAGTESWNGLAPVFFGVFVRIALVEEASRFLILVPLLAILNRRLTVYGSIGAAAGLVAGLGFAALENASYGMADINITLLRAFTAAPLHGACGIRVGAAVSSVRQHPLKALAFFVSAVLIHGAYNLMIVSPALPAALAIPTAYIALFASLSFIKDSGSDDENSINSRLFKMSREG